MPALLLVEIEGEFSVSLRFGPQNGKGVLRYL